jgi:hypothetical protein
MQLTKLIWPLAVMVTLSYVYNKYKDRVFASEQEHEYALVQQYLLTEPSLARSKKPIIWIHNTYDINARSWLDFQSRNTNELNQPYIYLTIQSIIEKCGENFNICLIDDTSFGRLLPSWAVDLQLVADPVRSKIRQLALAKVLYQYGGLLVPASFLCFQDLRILYDTYCPPPKKRILVTAEAMAAQQGTVVTTMLVGELIDRGSTSANVEVFPSPKFMGCSKESLTMQDFIAYLETQVSTDFTAESDFLGNTARWLYAKSLTYDVGIIPADELGQKDDSGTAVTIDKLMGNTFVHLSGRVRGLYIPSDEILRRTKYQWFARLSAKQALASDTIVGKYLLIQQG